MPRKRRANKNSTSSTNNTPKTMAASQQKNQTAMQKMFPPGTFSKWGDSGGRVVGSALGAVVNPVLSGPGGSIGSSLGSRLGKRIAQLVGFGDYRVKSNSIFREGMALPSGETVPSFGVLGNATRVRHREFIKDVVIPTSPGGFTLEGFNLNPGDSYTFPWLSKLARQYQQYRFEGVVLEFKTLASDITAGGALGAVIMASNYDVSAADFDDKLHMENSEFAVSAKPSQSQIHTIECDPDQTANKLYYTRDGGSLSGVQDPRFYDLCRFQIATSGLPGSAGTVLGELWVTYDVSLYKPVLDATNDGGHVVQLASTKTNLFGTSPTTYGTAITASANRVTFVEIGEYLMTVTYNGTALATFGFSSSTPASALWQNDNGLLSRTIQYGVRVTKPGQYVDLDGSASTTITDISLRVAKYDYLNI